MNLTAEGKLELQRQRDKKRVTELRKVMKFWGSTWPDMIAAFTELYSLMAGDLIAQARLVKAFGALARKKEADDTSTGDSW